MKERKMIVCKKCRKIKPHQAFGLCYSCYIKQHPSKPKMIVCQECGKLKLLHAKGLCHSCYMTYYNHEKGITKSMSKNKSCASYLGVFINEQLLFKIFKNVKQMPTHNPGFDFTCNKGKKVDAKSSVTKIIKHRASFWSFSIKKNKIADYFFCVAYTDRKNPEPIHMWLIPGEDVNNKTSITISESRLHK